MLTPVPLWLPLFTVVLVHEWYISRDALRSGCRAFAEVHRDAAGVVVEHRNELEADAERFQILAKRRDTYVLGVLQLGDRPLGDIEPAGQLDLADCFAMSKLVEPDLLECVDAQRGEPLGSAGLRDDCVAEFREFGSCQAVACTKSRCRAPRTVRSGIRQLSSLHERASRHHRGGDQSLGLSAGLLTCGPRRNTNHDVVHQSQCSDHHELRSKFR